MCLIMSQPPGDAPFPDEQLENGWQANKDGAGFMFVADGQLQIRKPFYKLKELKAAYASDHAAHGAASPFVIHFRWATHGDKTGGNTHPHSLAGGDAALVHNGILSEFDWGGQTYSDTAVFCGTVLVARTAEQLVSESFGKILADMIGKWNKFVIMDALGNVSIVNADQGVYDGSRWYSNTGYLPPTPKKHYQQWTNCSGYTHGGASTWERMDGEGVARGEVFDSTADALTAWRKRFDAPKYAEQGLSLFDEADLDDRQWAESPPVSVEAEIADLEEEQEAALAACDHQYAESLAYDIAHLRRGLEHDAELDLAMARDGR